MTIMAAGIYDITPEEYHSDPAPEPSLSSSGIKRLLSGSPTEFAAHHPRLTSWHEQLADERATEAMETGSIAHAIVLGKGARYVEAHPSDFTSPTTKKPYASWSGDAKKWKDAEKAKGNIVLTRGGERSAGVEAAASSMRDLLAEEYGDWPLGESEQVIIWQTETAHGPIWCRAMLDHLSRRHVLILDPKFTKREIDDRSLQNKAAAEKWHIQQQWYIEAVESLAPDLRGQLHFRFPVAQLVYPYQARFFDIDEQQPQWLEIAKADIDWATARYAYCLRSNSWAPIGRRCSMPPPDWLINESSRRQERSAETGEVIF